MQLNVLIPQGGLWIFSFPFKQDDPTSCCNSAPFYCVGDSFSLIKNVIIHPFILSCIKVFLFCSVKWQVMCGNCRSRPGAGELGDWGPQSSIMGFWRPLINCECWELKTMLLRKSTSAWGKPSIASCANHAMAGIFIWALAEWFLPSGSGCNKRLSLRLSALEQWESLKGSNRLKSTLNKQLEHAGATVSYEIIIRWSFGSPRQAY